MTTPSEIFSPEFLQDPYPTYRWLRENDPIHQSAPGVWVVTRYEDVRQVLGDPNYLHWTSRTDDPCSGALGRWVRLMDPRNASELRKSVLGLFTPTALHSLQLAMKEKVAAQLDRAEQAGGFDVVADLAFPLSYSVMLDLLGIPEQEREIFRRAGMMLFGHCMAGGGLVSAGPVAEMQQAIIAAMNRPPHSPPATILESVARARASGEAVDEEDAIAFSAIFFYAGSENIMNFLSLSVLTLSSHPQEWQRLAGQPDIMPQAIDELMRFESPVQMVNLKSAVQQELGGRGIRAGDTVLAAIGAANRDPARFDDPDRLDLLRRGNQHLSFGTGAMYCIGAELARMEARAVLGAVVARFAPFQLVENAARWRTSPPVLRGLESLGVSLSPWSKRNEPSLRATTL
jgi:cytochrome P450